MRKLRNTAAFALVEVVLALAIAAFALTSIIALLSVAAGSSRASSDDTLVATMAMNVVDDLRRQSFVDNTARNPPGDMTPKHKSGDPSVLPGTDDVAIGQTPPLVTPASVYFDVSGVRLRYANGNDMTKIDALAAGAIYLCTETMQGDAATLSATGSDGSATTQAVNQVNITLTFAWPLQAVPPPNTKVLHASIARYY